jgi:hypothetical protein
LPTDARQGQGQGLDVFYRESDDPATPTLLLLRGYPSPSPIFRHLIRPLEGPYSGKVHATPMSVGP